MSKQLVLVFRDNSVQYNGNECGTMRVTFGEVSTDKGTFDYIHDYSNEPFAGCNALSISCQWNLEDCSWAKAYQPYAFRVRQEEVELKSVEYKFKTMRKINAYLETQPSVGFDFGMYVYQVCQALKIKHFVVNPNDWSDRNSRTTTLEIHKVAEHLNYKIIERKLDAERAKRELERSEDTNSVYRNSQSA